MITSTTLTGIEGLPILESALRSIAPHVDAVLVVCTDEAAREEIAAICEGVRATSPARFFTRSWPWRDDFGAARNAALDIAAELGATWAITVDSDETIEGGEEIRPLLASVPPDVSAVMMPHLGGDYYQPRAIRLPAAARWAGRVHEYIPLSGPRFERAAFRDCPKSTEQMRAKRERDARILLEQTRENPDDPRWWYYLGDAEAGLDMPWIALERFERCAALPGWDEQRAWACYRAAELLSMLGRQDEAVSMAARGLGYHAGVAELAWIAALASYRAGRYEQALYWSRLADVHGVPGLGGNGRALAGRVLFRVPKGLTFGPAEVRQHALRQLGDIEGAELAAREREERIQQCPR